jgi:hypothetical protein
MPIDVSPGSFAAFTISVLFWWTVLCPAALLVIAALCGSRPHVRAALTMVVLVPPVVTLLPVAVMRGGPEAAMAAAAVLLLATAVALAAASLVRRSGAPERAERWATAVLLAGVAGGMVGSAALVGAMILS